MYRGTTPTLTFTLPIEVENFEVIYITFSQNEKNIVEKTKEDCDLGDLEGREIKLTLTMEETLKFDHKFPVEMQIRAKTNQGNAIASDIIKCSVGKILKEGEI